MLDRNTYTDIYAYNRFVIGLDSLTTEIIACERVYGAKEKAKQLELWYTA